MFRLTLSRGSRGRLVAAIGVLAVAAALAAAAPIGRVPVGWQIIRGAFRVETAADYSSRAEAPVAPQRPIEAAGVTQRGAPAP